MNFIIDFYLPATDLSLNTAHYGFGSGPMDVLTFNDDAFHIGINGNGIDDVRIDTGMELPIDQQGFIYKQPYSRENDVYLHKYRLESNKEYMIRYKFQECQIYGQPKTRDVTIYVNGEVAYDIPGGGIRLSDIKWLGQTNDPSMNPVSSRPYRIEVWYMDDVSSTTKLKDLSNTTIVLNTLVPRILTKMIQKQHFMKVKIMKQEVCIYLIFQDGSI